MRILLWIIGSISLIFLILLILIYALNFHPPKKQEQEVISPRNAPLLKKGQKLKVMTWNVQYLAGKNNVFYYDILDNSGPDIRPGKEDIATTLKEVARIIKDEDPDIILIQELDDGAKKTDYQDQLDALLKLIPKTYKSHTSAFYWKSSFVPHPKILGAVGMKLSVISKYKIEKAVRHQLPLIPKDFVTKQFNLKRCIIETHFPVKDQKESFVVLNIHLDAFAQGTDTVKKQVKQLKSLLDQLTRQNHQWIVGGDFNSLPPGNAYKNLAPAQKKYYKPKTEILPLYNSYQAIPSNREVTGRAYKKWFTHFPNDPSVTKPDRTIDYLFLSSKLKIGEHYVRQHDTLQISDHLPIITEITLP